MSYTPTTWTTGDTITATKLNKMEQGIANAVGVMIVNCVYDDLDKTFAEIYTALKDGIPVYCKEGFEEAGPTVDFVCIATLRPILAARKYNNVYAVYVAEFMETVIPSDAYSPAPAVKSFHANSANGYPSFAKLVYPSSVSYED